MTSADAPAVTIVVPTFNELGNVAPLQSQEAIPNLARLLLDPDLNVRLAAATTNTVISALYDSGADLLSLCAHALHPHPL